jgi:hypothetical protein
MGHFGFGGAGGFWGLGIKNEFLFFYTRIVIV